MRKIVRTKLPVNSVRLCFRKRSTDCCEGRIYGVAFQDAVEFHDSAELIMKVDDLFNQIGHPQPHHILRSFGDTENYCSYCSNPERYHTDSEIEAMHGEEGTFELIMLTRHSAEWQGILRNVDNMQSEKFETILECMRILNQDRLVSYTKTL